MDSSTHPRPVDWLEDARRSLKTRLSKEVRFGISPDYVAGRLSALLLERLPNSIACAMLEMLPETKKEELKMLEKSVGTSGDASIGYTTFIERAGEAVGTQQSEDAIREVTDAFLWGVFQEIPADLKARLHEVLPTELKSRMDLYSARDNESKVA